MLGRSAYSGDKYRAAKSAHIGSMDRQLRSLQKRLERVRGRVSTDAAEGADKFGKAIASMLDEVAERFRDGSLSDEAAKIGTEAAKLSNDALRRLSREIEARPLVALAVAIGVGILVGLVSQRRS
jgi:ElaB/YqjD/DUF883 family membrane-anchored ribosome-binding protein